MKKNEYGFTIEGSIHNYLGQQVDKTLIPIYVVAENYREAMMQVLEIAQKISEGYYSTEFRFYFRILPE